MAADLIFWDSFDATEYGLIFADASTLACCSVAITMVEGDTSVVKGSQAYKNVILPFYGSNLATNMAKNLCNALRGSTTMLNALRRSSPSGYGCIA